MARPFDYDYEEFGQPIGGWISFENKPTPQRTDRAFKVGALLVGLLTVVGTILWVPQASGRALDTPAIIGITVAALIFGGLAYGFVWALGMIVVGLVGMVLDGPEITVNRRAISHDIRLRSTWAALLESTLFLAAAGMIVFSGIDAVKNQSTYSASIFVLLFALTFWPYLRHRIRHGTWP